jgi:multidrug resistance efflux pump
LRGQSSLSWLGFLAVVPWMTAFIWTFKPTNIIDIQLVPRLSEPTLVTAVLAEPNVPVKKGQPLFQFDRRPYEYKVNQLQAQLAQAKQNVLILQSDVNVAMQKVDTFKSHLKFSQTMQDATENLAKTGAAPKEEALKRAAQMLVDEAGVNETQAEADRARLRYELEIGGANTTVAEVQAELDQALYYLDNTTLVAPEDGRIVNLQVRPGTVAGDLRVGAIASFICEADPGSSLSACSWRRGLADDAQHKGASMWFNLPKFGSYVDW